MPARGDPSRLLCDGPSDRCLLFPIRWALELAGWRGPAPEWADLRPFDLPDMALRSRLRALLEHYPTDVLFVHRDAEAEPHAKRVKEIREALTRLDPPLSHVCVVPVRMTEAWLLHDEVAIPTPPPTTSSATPPKRR